MDASSCPRVLRLVVPGDKIASSSYRGALKTAFRKADVEAWIFTDSATHSPRGP